MRKTLSGLPWLVQLLLVIFVDGLFGRKTSSKIVGAILLTSFILSIVSFIGLPAVLGWIVRVVYAVCLVCDIITMIFVRKITLFAA